MPVLPAPRIHLLLVLLKRGLAEPILQERHGHDALADQSARLREVVAQTRERQQFLGVHDLQVAGQTDGGVIHDVPGDAAAAERGEQVVELPLYLLKLLIANDGIRHQLSHASLPKARKAESLPQRSGAQVHRVESSRRLVDDGDELRALELHVPVFVEVVRHHAGRAWVKDVKTPEAVQVEPREDPQRPPVRELGHLTFAVLVDDLRQQELVLGQRVCVSCHCRFASSGTSNQVASPRTARRPSC